MSVIPFLENEKIWIAGHKGMVGSAIKRQLESQGRSVITVDRSVLDLRNQSHVEFWSQANKPTAIIFAAVKNRNIPPNRNYASD